MSIKSFQEDKKVNKGFLVTALVFICLAVALGAFGAHGLAKILTEKQLATFDSAVKYQMYHGLGLLVLSLSGNAFHAKFWILGQRLLVVGTIGFSASLYSYLATDLKVFAYFTPLGGSALILGWLWLIVGAWKGPKR